MKMVMTCTLKMEDLAHTYNIKKLRKLKKKWLLKSKKKRKQEKERLKKMTTF